MALKSTGGDAQHYILNHYNTRDIKTI